MSSKARTAIPIPKCPIHHIDLVCFCPACRGAQTSPRKARSSRLNGLKGGRPRRRRG